MSDAAGDPQHETGEGPAPERQLWVVSLGTMDYRETLELQRRAARLRIAGTLAQDTLLLVEHPPVVTLGRSLKPEHLLLAQDQLRAGGVEIYDVERGGDVTFHGPGQLVGYPIVDLRRHRQDLHWYLRQLEETLITACATFGLSAARRTGFTGVWTTGGKLASIGVHARDWVTWHGFALNVNTDLSYFELIVPCGIENVHMTSLSRELGGRTLDPAAVRRVVAEAFGRVFSLGPIKVSAEKFVGMVETGG